MVQLVEKQTFLGHGVSLEDLASFKALGSGAGGHQIKNCQV